MAITVNGQILRNLPEQVSKNTEDILDLQDTTNLQGDKIAALENSIITDITLNNLEVTGNTVIGNANTDTLVVTGASSFNGDVNVTGDVTASGDLAAASASFTGNVNITGNLSVGGNISPLENICDAQGRKRFLEWDIVGFPSIAGVTLDYAKASLSGTHLMCVLALSIENGSTITDGIAMGSFVLPQWIRDKIMPLWGTYYVDKKTFEALGDDWSTQSASFALVKRPDNLIGISKGFGPFTATADRKIRVQFDLLIDVQ